MWATSHEHVGRNRSTFAPIRPIAVEGSSARGREVGTLGGFGEPKGGFSLLELMASVAILMVVGGAVFSLLAYYQKAYGTTRLKADMYDDVRGAVELMSQEIGQTGMVSLPYPTLTVAVTGGAGARTVTVSSSTGMVSAQIVTIDTGVAAENVTLTAVGTGTITGIFTKNHSIGTSVYAPPTLAGAVVANTSAQTVNVSSATSMFVGEQLIIDAGATTQERVALTAVSASTSPNTINGIFTQNHASGATVNVQGVFPYGVLSSSDATHLQLIGDINADGSLVFVQYDCNTAANPGFLTRSQTPITPTGSAANAYQTLLSNMVANPGGTACFQYPNPVTAGSYTLDANIAVTLTVQTTAKDPQTGAYLTMTKSFLNLEPRNVLIAIKLINQGGLTQLLQPTPPGVPYSGG
jgi:pilin/secretion family protein with methylation motif